jgi:hypothetical protein
MLLVSMTIVGRHGHFLTRVATVSVPKTTTPKTAAAVISKQAPAKRGRKPKPVAPQAVVSSKDDMESEDELAGEKGATANDTEVHSVTTSQDLSAMHPDVQYWLMKAEPESRLVNGHDVKFSIDDLRAKVVPEAWDGEYQRHIPLVNLHMSLISVRCAQPCREKQHASNA